MDAQAEQNIIRLRKEWLRIRNVENDVVHDLIITARYVPVAEAEEVGASCYQI